MEIHPCLNNDIVYLKIQGLSHISEVFNFSIRWWAAKQNDPIGNQQWGMQHVDENLLNLQMQFHRMVINS